MRADLLFLGCVLFNALLQTQLFAEGDNSSKAIAAHVQNRFSQDDIPSDLPIEDKLVLDGSVKTAKIDLGYIEIGNSRYLRYQLVNASDTALTLLDVHPGCGCISVLAETTALAPNGKLDLYFRLLPEKRENISRIVSIELDQGPVCKIVIDAKVRDIFDLDHPRIGFNFRGKGSLLKIRSPFGIVPSKIVSQHPALRVVDLETFPNRAEFTLEAVEGERESVGKSFTTFLKVTGGGMTRDVRLDVLNTSLFTAKNEPLLARKKSDHYETIAFISGSDLVEQPLSCTILEDPSIICEFTPRTRVKPLLGVYRIRILAETNEHSVLTVVWSQAGKERLRTPVTIIGN